MILKKEYTWAAGISIGTTKYLSQVHKLPWAITELLSLHLLQIRIVIESDESVVKLLKRIVDHDDENLFDWFGGTAQLLISYRFF